ncbi:mRNA surveillance protein pelota [Haladaptatus cibarius]|uniref:mRNA surveillance protein pelota n=1 Tax=Haladaptatus cibarius TaxID=453847 RepID=UPI0006789717|nr:mRNA surveillance protein pelota [Haladaptatus cibarius]
MQIHDRTSLDGNREQITLVPESLDDLWHLTYLLEPGDSVTGDTTRRIQRADDQMRDTGGEREHMHITLDVEDVEFHRFANRVRVGGIITDCSREDQLGLHHTVNVEEREKISIAKVWKRDQLDRLDDAVEATENPDVVIATVEEGQAHIHTVAQYGADEYTSFSGTTGKGEYAGGRTELFDQLGSALSHLDVDAIILAGPGFTKQDAYDHIAENYSDLTDLITQVDVSAVGDRGVHEVLKRGAVAEVQEETRIGEEAELIDELMRRMAEGAKAAYGIEEVAKAADFGAVERLLVLDERLRKERGALGEDEAGGEWAIDVNEVITDVERKGGDVTVFSHEFAPGEQLSNLGGIAALLRYRLE